MTLLNIVTGPSQVQHGRVVRVDESHLESITNDLQLARVGGSLKGDGVDERSNSTVLVFPAKVRKSALATVPPPWTLFEAHQVALVILGILKFSGILLSSTGTRLS